MTDLQTQLEDVQTVYSINRMMSSMSSDFDLFKFLIGEKGAYCRFDHFIYLYQKNDANLAKVVADFLQRNLDTNFLAATEAAKQLYSAQQVLHKFDYSQHQIEFIHGDSFIFKDFERNYHFSAKNVLSKPGRYSEDAYLIAFPKQKLFIKPTESLEKALNESKAYMLSMELGISKYFLPSCVVKIKKNQKSEQYAVVTAILPSDFMSLDDLEQKKPGSNDGFVKSLVEQGLAHKLALFDYLIDNSDRHKNNIYISGNKFFLIDHTEAFIKKKDGFVPGYLRLNSYKIDKKLPISKNELEIKNWLVNLQVSDSEINKKIEHLKDKPSVSIAINQLWDTYYGA